MEEKDKTISIAELKKHNKEGDLWIAVHGKVYDLSKFDAHPGGQEALNENAGTDATLTFDGVDHSLTDIKELKKYLIGNLEGYVENTTTSNSDGLRQRKTNATDDQVGGVKGERKKEEAQNQTKLVLILFIALTVLMGAKYLFDSM